MAIDSYNKTQLISPAASLEGMQAAIRNGADGIYFGTSRFSARNRAENIEEEEIVKAVEYAHHRCVKVFLAINTLLSDKEIQPAKQIALNAYKCGADGIITADLGFAAVLKKDLPDFPLHASTQMTIYDKNGIDFCSEMGFSGITLPRELSVDEIAKLTEYAGYRGIKTQVFVHGALCVCYSGQCLMSSMIGARSGNRGQCAQPCSLSYDLKFEEQSIISKKPLLATGDMWAVEHIKDLVEAGVGSLKIEGRMRSPFYAGAVTSVYSKILSDVHLGKESKISIEDKKKLLLAYNRGESFSDDYLKGGKGFGITVSGYTGSHGIFIGKIVAKNSTMGILDIQKDGDYHPGISLDKGDVVCIRQMTGNMDGVSAPIGSCEDRESFFRIKGFHPDVIDGIQINDSAFLMEDASLKQQVLSADDKRTKISAVLEGQENKISLTFKVETGGAKGVSYKYESDTKSIASGEYKEISTKRCKEQISKLKSTPFEADEITIEYLPKAPVSFINKMRRSAADGLEKEISKFFTREIPVQTGDVQDNEKTDKIVDVSDVERIVRSDESFLKKGKPLISAFFYEWDGKADSVTCEADIYELPVISFFNPRAREGLKILKNREPNSNIVLHMPPAASYNDAGEMENILESIMEEGVDGILSGNPGNKYLCEKLATWDYRDLSANIFNCESVKVLQKSGAFSTALSPELSFKDIMRMAKKCFSTKEQRLELPVYGRLRLMYTEHCPVGLNKNGCRACVGNNKHSYSIKDKKGMCFPVICHEQFCTADILNSNILCAPKEFIELSEICDTTARIIFTKETPAQRTNIVRAFKELSEGRFSGMKTDMGVDEVWKIAKSIAKTENCSLTGGHLKRGIG